jgi:hypothetical protein
MKLTVNWALADLRSAAAALFVALAAGVVFALPAIARASDVCPNEAFRSGPSSKLPDCRAYEMVSPPEKNGGGVDGGFTYGGFGEPAPNQAAANGESVTYASLTAFTETGPLSASLNSQYESVRGPNGWTTRSIEPPQAYPGGQFDQNPGAPDWSLYQGFTEDLSEGFLVSSEPALVAGAAVGYYMPYLRDGEGYYQAITDVTPPVQHGGVTDSSTGGFKANLAGFSANGRDVIFSANDALTPNAIPGQTNLYEWVEGKLELVSVLPGSGAPVAGAEFGVGKAEERDNDLDHAISSDGSRVFWTRPGSAEGQQLYMHETGPSGARTVEVSASQKPGGGPVAPAQYRAASADGSLVYFTSCAQLTSDSTAVYSEAGLLSKQELCGAPGTEKTAEEETGADLYQYDADTGKLTDLTVDHNPGETANVKGVLGASEDGSYVYFAAQGNLTGGALPPLPEGLSGGTTVAKALKFYVWHEGTIAFIGYSGPEEYEQNAYAPTLQFHEARVSPNGNYLAFNSSLALTGYRNVKLEGTCFGPLVGRGENRATARCLEVFEYDAATNELTCASCNQLGLPPTGAAKVPGALSIETINPGGWETETYQQRYLLGDGRLFFESEDAVLPQATNGLMNVYEYEPDGVGSCATAGGCVYLISSGTGAGQSKFVDASASGEDVFFTTYDQLVPQDGDEAADLYDARVGGGFSTPAPPACSGEACKPSATPAPSIYGAPPSATFFGSGNLAATAPAPVTSVKKKSVTKHKAPKSKKRKRDKRNKKSKASARPVRGTRAERKGGR